MCDPGPRLRGRRAPERTRECPREVLRRAVRPQVTRTGPPRSRVHSAPGVPGPSRMPTLSPCAAGHTPWLITWLSVPFWDWNPHMTDRAWKRLAF